jgi:hypothetical protein
MTEWMSNISHKIQFEDLMNKFESKTQEKSILNTFGFTVHFDLTLWVYNVPHIIFEWINFRSSVSKTYFYGSLVVPQVKNITLSSMKVSKSLKSPHLNEMINFRRL